MQIRHERPMSDLGFQVRAPLKLTLSDGRIVTIERWSLASLHFPEDTDILPKTGSLAIPFQGIDIQFPVRFSEGSEKGELVFEDLTGRQRETLAVFYRSILSGKMASTEDVITSLDTPVDLVPMGETEDEVTQGSKGKSPRLLRIIWNVVFYVVLAATVFGLIGGQIFNRLSHVSLKHARVVAPLINLRSGEATYVDRILVAPGTQVNQGDVLVRLSNPDRNARLADIRGEIASQDERVREARAALMRHLERQDEERQPFLYAYQMAVAARTAYDFFAGRNLTDVLWAKRQLDQFDAGRSNAAGDFHDTRRTLQRFLSDRKDALGRLRRDLGIQKAAGASADILATADGVVTQIDVFPNQFLARGASVATIEENAPRVVRAWLNEARAEAVYPSMHVKVRFSDGAGTRSIAGTIDTIVATIDPDVTNEFGIIVTATLDQMDTAATRAILRPDAPVALRAVKRWSIDLPWLN